MNKIPVSFRLDEDLYHFIRTYAQNGRMTVTQVLVQLVLDLYQQNRDEARTVEIEHKHTQSKEGGNPQ
jgi:hypothetical protein